MMPSFASNARFKAKSGQENALMEASLKFDIADYAGCLSHQCISAGDGRFQSVVFGKVKIHSSMQDHF